MDTTLKPNSQYTWSPDMPKPTKNLFAADEAVGDSDGTESYSDESAGSLKEFIVDDDHEDSGCADALMEEDARQTEDKYAREDLDGNGSDTQVSPRVRAAATLASMSQSDGLDDSSDTEQVIYPNRRGKAPARRKHARSASDDEEELACAEEAAAIKRVAERHLREATVEPMLPRPGESPPLRMPGVGASRQPFFDSYKSPSTHAQNAILGGCDRDCPPPPPAMRRMISEAGPARGSRDQDWGRSGGVRRDAASSSSSRAVPFPILEVPPALIAQPFVDFPDVTVPPGFIWRQGPRAGRTEVAEPPEEDPMADESEFAEVIPAHPTTFKGGKKGSRRWVFTLNNPSKEEYMLIHQYLQRPQVVWASLACEFVTTSHLQGGFRLKDATTRTALARLKAFCSAWIAVARGTEEHCRDYMKKQGHAREYNPQNFSPGQGCRTDVLAAVEKVRDMGEAGIQAILADDPTYYVRFHSGLEKLALRTQKPRRLSEPPTVIWFMGQSNHGKTYQAAKAATECVASVQPGGTMYEWNVGNFPWFDGYQQEKVMLLNEFRVTTSRGAKIPMDTWCKMWDVLGFRCEVKGTMTQLQCSHFYITCTQHPRSMYEETSTEPCLQFLRRITKVILCERTGEEGSFEYSQRDLGRATDPLPFDMP